MFWHCVFGIARTIVTGDAARTAAWSCNKPSGRSWTRPERTNYPAELGGPGTNTSYRSSIWPPMNPDNGVTPFKSRPVSRPCTWYGRISQELFDSWAMSMRWEQEAVVHKIQGHQGGHPSPRRSSYRHAPPDESSKRTIPPAACQRAASIAPDGCGKGVVEGRHIADSSVGTVRDFAPFEPGKF